MKSRTASSPFTLRAAGAAVQCARRLHDEAWEIYQPLKSSWREGAGISSSEFIDVKIAYQKAADTYLLAANIYDAIESPRMARKYRSDAKDVQERANDAAEAAKRGGASPMSRRDPPPPKRDRGRDTASEFRRQVQEIAVEQGWRVERTEKGHWRFIPPDPSKRIVVLPGTSVSRSGTRNALADLRRSGLVVARDPIYGEGHSPRSGRDQDYRGQKTTVDFSKLTYMARMNKPGALAVLQDAIEIYFPKQFGRAQIMAQHDAKRSEREIFVFFNGRTARNRFVQQPRERQHPRAIPFSQGNALLLKEYGLPPGLVVVYSTKTGKHIRRELAKAQRRSKTAVKQQKRAR